MQYREHFLFPIAMYRSYSCSLTVRAILKKKCGYITLHLHPFVLRLDEKKHVSTRRNTQNTY